MLYRYDVDQKKPITIDFTNQFRCKTLVSSATTITSSDPGPGLGLGVVDEPTFMNQEFSESTQQVTL